MLATLRQRLLQDGQNAHTQRPQRRLPGTKANPGNNV